MALHDNELVANLGNFVNRVMNLSQKYYAGIIPTVDAELQFKGVDEAEDVMITYSKALETLNTKVKELEACLLGYEFKAAIQVVMEIASFGNVMLQRNEPWKVWKTNPEDAMVKTVMNLSLQIAAVLSVTIEPFLPFTSAKLRTLLGLEAVSNGDFTRLKVQLENSAPILEQGHQVGAPDLLFAKINDRKDKSRAEMIEVQKVKLEALIATQAKAAQKAAPVKEMTTFDEFSKTDLRIGTILTC